ncbi:MAG: ATP-dependent zinc metalloprotease FtsH [Chlamydiae bacterium]|nr:ATP-dependent zinc metalloprotease FtsH [Chlamydiota bacterium]
MADDNKNNNNPPKRSFPGSFFLFILAAIFIVFVIQNFTNQKTAKVSFSHQLEHLVNLNLIHPEENRKTSLNDNLVTFSGKFRSTTTPEGKSRFRFLELLNKNHQLTSEQGRISGELGIQEQRVRDAADWYLKISGVAVPASGYVVVGGIYDTPERVNRIVVQDLSNRDVLSVKDLDSRLAKLDATDGDQVAVYGSELATLIQNFRSPILGIGSESMKQQLKSMSDSVLKAQSASTAEQLSVYQSAMVQLKAVSAQLNQFENHTHLSQLRSVRSYKEEFNQFNIYSSELGENQEQLDKARQPVANVIWYFDNKELSTRALEKQDPEVFSHWFANAQQEWDGFATNKGYAFKAPDQPRNTVLERTFKSEEPAPNYFSYIFSFLPVVLVVLLLWFIFSRQMKGMGNNAMSFGKSTAKKLNKTECKVTFADVAGIDEAKEELEEIVDFLREPSKFTALGGRIPKGVLCIGPPGTGKTLIAKAIAGEADRPFFAISGSDFVEMFVGVGASRIRDLFGQAKKEAPCIIFIDEIDAVGRHRGAGIGGGHDEREQTLNQLLVEMDGFNSNEGVILVAATNRADVLDKALLRPGRFDRRIVVDLPDVKGRYEILKVHARKIKLDPSVDLMSIAKGTAGSSGADLANLLNEAALIASRLGRAAVTGSDASEACDKVRYGKERRSLELSEQEKYNTAVHESGHAVAALCVKHADPVDKVTIIPRGFSLGATHFLPEKNRVSWWKKELYDQLIVLLAGRAAEEIFLGDISSGAQNDIERATQIGRNMICGWGMNDQLGNVALDESKANQYYPGMGSNEKKYSDRTAEVIDSEVKKMMDEAYQSALTIVRENKEKVQLMTDMLVEFETLDAEDVRNIVSGGWDAESKRKKLKRVDELQKLAPTEPPPPPSPEQGTTGKLALD